MATMGGQWEQMKSSSERNIISYRYSQPPNMKLALSYVQFWPAGRERRDRHLCPKQPLSYLKAWGPPLDWCCFLSIKEPAFKMQAAHINTPSEGGGGRQTQSPRLRHTGSPTLKCPLSFYVIIAPNPGKYINGIRYSCCAAHPTLYSGMFPHWPAAASSAPYGDVITFCVKTVIKAFDLIADSIKSSGSLTFVR